jgi:hypothetical protein
LSSKSSEKKRRIEQEKKRESAIGLAFVVVIVVLLGGAVWYFVAPTIFSGHPPTTPTGDPTLTTCISEGSLAMHIHVHLSITVNGRPVDIPANVGVDATCTRPVHTHDDSGEIHIESPVVYPFNLGDFFMVWGKPFDNTQILTYKVDSAHNLRMTVNGIVSSQFQNYVLQDNDVIQITYGS